MATPRERERCVGSAIRAYLLLPFLLLAPATLLAQSLAEQLAPLALDPEVRSDPAGHLQCATPREARPWLSAAFAADPSRAGVSGDMESLPDGHPLYADQTPRFLQPNHTGTFGFDRLLVLGDHATVTFERVDADADNEHTAETWTRTGTDTVAGHLVSVFTPRWNASVLRDTLRRYPWGVDAPSLYWGRLVVPGSTGDDGEHDHVNVRLAIVPPNIPSSTVVRINDRVQYASHAVNISDADFGDSRILGGDTALNLPEITKLFYEHFADEYDVIAVVSQATQLGGYGGFHQVVRNAIRGIGLDVFDSSATYGSAGVLQGVEGYPSAGWASWETVLHEQGHQYGDYSNAWADAGSTATTAPAGASAIDRLGHAPDVHTPLLSPGAVTYGAVLKGTVRVGSETGADGTAGYRIERTVPLVTYHPLTLYRMGLLPAADVGSVQVFVNQGQFDDETSTAPEPGTAVSGETVEVSINDLLAADGTRSGPAVTSVRRAVVYVSRGGLAPQSEMNVVNYFAQRLGESSGVTSWDRFPSFAEATGNRATMSTSIRRRAGASATALSGPSGRCAKVGTGALVGIELDAEIGGCVDAGSTLTVSGRLTLDDRSDYYAVCVRMRRYGDEAADRLYECDELNVDEFSVEVEFAADKTGGYTMEAFAFWPNAEAQFPLSTYTGAIEAVTAGSAAALTAP